jgi:lipoprotein-anchoring transpeptidase ErfK/SrfK
MSRMKKLSRRDFLKLGGLALGSLAFTSFLPGITEFDDIDAVRVATKQVSVYRDPSEKSPIVATWYRNDLVHVYDQVDTQTLITPYLNPLWYRVWGGYMNQARLQKVKALYNEPLTAVPETGLIGEVTVPYAQAYVKDRWNGWQTTYPLYYGSVHWFNAVEDGPDGQPWYRILDEADHAEYYIPAVQMRPIPPAELTPLSPDVPFDNRRIDVDLTSQKLACYEYDQVVFRAEISSGWAGLASSEPTTTPTGHKNIEVKMPSKHMGEADLAAGIDDYVLPGVPWVSFFTKEGHAFHGTYWHDNFGATMSHGCVNMRTEDAKWLFRWSLPPAGFDDINKQTHSKIGFGTQVDIHY